MKLNFTFNVQILNKKFKLREISFLEYRNLVKSIISDDPALIKSSFVEFLQSVCDKEPENVQEAFLLLLKYRELIHGKQIEFSVGDTKINYSSDDVFNFFNTEVSKIYYEINNEVLELGLPNSFITEDNVIENTLCCIYSVDGRKVLNFNDLPALPFQDIYKTILQNYISVKYKIKFIDYDLSFFDLSCLFFIKSIFLYDLQNLYDLEYTLRRNLNFSVNDLSTLSFPECNMLLKMHLKELAEEEKKANKVDSMN